MMVQLNYGFLMNMNEIFIRKNKIAKKNEIKIEFIFLKALCLIIT